MPAGLHRELRSVSTVTADDLVSSPQKKCDRRLLTAFATVIDFREARKAAPPCAVDATDRRRGRELRR